MRNMFDFLMQQLDSRASRMSPNQALLTLHADCIGGQDANYRKWYLAAQLDLDDAVGHIQNPGLTRAHHRRTLATGDARHESVQPLRQIALYLFWGKGTQVCFCPEALCFIFKCADDYYHSSECQNRVEPTPEGMYLRSVVHPLYHFIRDQGYEVIDGKFVCHECDHEDIIGYDDVNQL
ncbi:family 48 glycosyltransferase, partial [Mycena latifolia]